MSRLQRNLCLFVVACIGFTFAEPVGADDPAKEPRDITGIWLGTLDVQVIQLRVAFHVKKDGEKFTATMDSLDQGVAGIAVDAVTVEGNDVVFSVKAIGGRYAGTLNEAGNTIAGKWTQGGQVLPLELKPVEKLPSTVRPQDPKPPFPYDAEEVIVENKAGGVKLAGTLTIPKGAGPHPAVVMITGSGPQNRDEELMNHRPFLVIADYLTRRGIAVLRCDDRGVGGSTHLTAGEQQDPTGEYDVMHSTVQDFAGDARAMMVFLQKHERIDGKRIGLVGHSEGGLIAPMVAAEHDDVAFIVMLAGMGVSGGETVISQTQAMLKKMGLSPGIREANRKAYTQMMELIATEPDDDKVIAAMKEIEEKVKAELSEADRATADLIEQQMGMTDEAKEMQGRMMVTPWFRSVTAAEPADYLKKTKCPVLAINGELDMQVLPELHLPAIEEALKAAGNRDFKTMELKGLNHLFQTAKTGMIDEYAAIDETFAPSALKIVGDWIVERVK